MAIPQALMAILEQAHSLVARQRGRWHFLLADHHATDGCKAQGLWKRNRKPQKRALQPGSDGRQVTCKCSSRQSPFLSTCGRKLRDLCKAWCA
ncbi:hypothetical protein GOP47_0000002 [Adiantum capillus-veneris]|uniref:Uncharacterized protein n=1 Tax=Adiantum capillus-veneris TaxID=13818 RepID=A0A9D4VCQ3_ADICA|nr:hypothetical protein GOP47_0000002 [Adiantum capillus-veneris]